MSGRVWLASYPKSGNTWVRLLIGCLFLADGEAMDINRTLEHGGIASARLPFDHETLIESGLLTHAEIEPLRPRVHAATAPDRAGAAPVEFVKTHDAYALTAMGEPLLGGASGAKSAIVIVRDPRDIAASLAHHNQISIEDAVTLMDDHNAAFSHRSGRQSQQLPQRLGIWSGHVAGWVEQDDIPIHLLRYEDLQRDAAGALHAAMAAAGLSCTPAEADRAARLSAFSAVQRQERETGFSERAEKATLFFRRGTAGGWRDELTARQIETIERAHGPMMRRLGYPLSSAAAAAGARAAAA